MADKTSVAVLGLGIMGTGMASRLLSKGFDVTVWNRSAGKGEALQSSGAKVAKSPRDAVAGAKVVISMLADDIAARKVWLGEQGALAGAEKDATLIECSTITTGWIKELSAAASQHGLELLDAPVTGSKNQAAAGELTFLVGGSKAALESARPVLTAMSKQIVYLGPSGSGALMKLINNFVCGVQVIGFAEALAAIERSNLDPETALGVLTGGAPGSPIVKLMATRMTARDYDPNFPLKLTVKDIGYAQREMGNMDIGGATLRTFERAIAAGHGDRDFSSVVEVLRAK